MKGRWGPCWEACVWYDPLSSWPGPSHASHSFTHNTLQLPAINKALLQNLCSFASSSAVTFGKLSRINVQSYSPKRWCNYSGSYELTRSAPTTLGIVVIVSSKTYAWDAEAQIRRFKLEVADSNVVGIHWMHKKTLRQNKICSLSVLQKKVRHTVIVFLGEHPFKQYI